MDISRRQLLTGIGAGVGTVALGCGDRTKPDPDASLGLLGDIDTLVVLCMENRSFDHYLGSLRFLEGRSDINGLVGTESNPAPGGGVVPIHRLDDFTVVDPPHEWDNCHTQWNHGANDGFVISHAGANQDDVMTFHARSQLPITYALADAAAICQRWHASVMGPTWPNRFYLHAATSHGEMAGNPVSGLTTIWDRLNDRSLPGMNYFHDVP